MVVDNMDMATTLDENILAVLPVGGIVVRVTPGGLSEFCDTRRIDLRHPGGTIESFFQKECKGEYGRDLMTASFTAESTMNSFIPEFTPQPILMGTYKSDENKHFLLSNFVEMVEDTGAIPSPKAYMRSIIALHTSSMQSPPEGKFGFPANTWFGDLEQNNAWEGSWEVFWTRMMHEILEREERIRGEHSQDPVTLKAQFFEKVLPRYLRPLETDGRSVTPCLLYANLWPGNCHYKLDLQNVCMYDASAFWGHNEVDLGVFRNPGYPLGRFYLREYWKHIPVLEPEEDADSRNTLYMIRNQVLLSTLYPDQSQLRDIFAANMPLLVDKWAAEQNTNSNS